MSDTPRTDAAALFHYDIDQCKLFHKVYAEFARALERELNAANARIAALEAHIARLEAIGDVFLKTLADSLEDPLHWNDDAAQAEKDWNQAKEAKP